MTKQTCQTPAKNKRNNIRGQSIAWISLSRKLQEKLKIYMKTRHWNPERKSWPKAENLPQHNFKERKLTF